MTGKEIDIDTMVNVLTRVTVSALEYWIARIQSAAEASGDNPEDFKPCFLVDHCQRLFRLIQKGTPLPDARKRAAELVILLNPVILEMGYFADWLAVVRGLAVAMYNLPVEDPALLGVLWRIVGDCYKRLRRLKEAWRSYDIAAQITTTGGEPSRDLHVFLEREKGSIRAQQVRFEEALETGNQLLADAHQTGDLYTLALGRSLLSYVYMQAFRFADSFTQAQQAFVVWRYLGDKKQAAQALHYMAEAARLSERLDIAQHYLALTYDQVQTLGDPAWMAHLENTLGSLAADRYQLHDAQDHLSRAREYFQAVDDTRQLTTVTHTLGVVHYRAGDHRQAQALLEESTSNWKRLDNRWLAALSEFSLGKSYEADRQPEKARLAYQDALVLVRQVEGGDPGLARNIEDALQAL